MNLHDTHRSPLTVEMLKVVVGSNSQREEVTVKEDPPRGVGIVVAFTRVISHSTLSGKQEKEDIKQKKR